MSPFSLLLLPMLSSFLPSSLSSAFRLVGSALLLWNASLLPCVVGPVGPPTIPVPAALTAAMYASYCGHYSPIGSSFLEPALIPLWTPHRSSNHTIYTAPLPVSSL